MINLTTSKVFGIHARSFMHGHIYPETMGGCGNFTHQGQWDVAVGCPIPMIKCKCHDAITLSEDKMPTIVWLKLIELDKDLIMFDPRGLFLTRLRVNQEYENCEIMRLWVN